MDADVKELWIDALTSGDYSQTENKLRKADGFCCLGVLCDLYVKIVGDPDAKWKKKKGYYAHSGDYKFTINGVQADEALPFEVMTWANLKHRNPEVPEVPSKTKPGRRAHSLAEMNDHGYSFEEIAKVIVKNL